MYNWSKVLINFFPAMCLFSVCKNVNFLQLYIKHNSSLKDTIAML